MLIILAIEVWFECEALAYVYVAVWPINVTVWGLLVSHWICLATELAHLMMTRRLSSSFYIGKDSALDGLSTVEIMKAWLCNQQQTCPTVPIEREGDSAEQTLGHSPMSQRSVRSARFMFS